MGLRRYADSSHFKLTVMTRLKSVFSLVFYAAFPNQRDKREDLIFKNARRLVETNRVNLCVLFFIPTWKWKTSRCHCTAIFNEQLGKCLSIRKFSFSIYDAETKAQQLDISQANFC